VKGHSGETSFFGPGNTNAFLTKGWDQIAESLKTTFEQPADTLSISSNNIQVTMLDDDVAIVTEYAVQTINPPLVAEQQIMQVRGTQVLKKIDRKWRLVHLHWSTLPTE